MGKSTRNAFKIIATVSGNLNIQNEQHTLQYKFSRGHTDELIISSNKITISGTRSKRTEFDDVFKNNKSEIYFQFIKSYVYYSIANGIIPEIQSIMCYDNKNTLVKEYTQNELRNLQPKGNVTNLRRINKNKLQVIFKSTNEGVKHLYATTTLIRSLCCDDDNDIFEKLWKSYNSIYRVRSSKRQEWECLEEMGHFMTNTPTDYPLSTAHVSNLSKKDITDATRWYAMLENNFVTRMNAPNIKEQKFSEFLKKYSDSRLVEIANETIDFQKGFWTVQALRTSTSSIINSRLNNPTKHDIELVDVLCNCYMYYLRNKILHGEQADHSFRFIPLNKESITLKFSSELLFLVVCDLINNQNF
ncbi:hypothetical protein JEP40_15295 [Proteus vulgaris]|uniref:hypothetical protein n=1 Tax=Proteus vulgaris TaxID=585 RepID=UPI0018E42991|nr:hypothetical protein [Proteus vulgaris]MBI6530475.1 hypothetical protein [Proteus vulgaris]